MYGEASRRRLKAARMALLLTPNVRGVFSNQLLHDVRLDTW